MDAIERYILDNSTPEQALLHELERETYLRVLNPRMISGHVQGRLLEMIVHMLRPAAHSRNRHFQRATRHCRWPQASTRAV